MNLLYIQGAEYREDKFYIKVKSGNWCEVNEKLEKQKEYIKQLAEGITKKQFIREYDDIKKVCVLFGYTLPKDKQFIF